MSDEGSPMPLVEELRIEARALADEIDDAQRAMRVAAQRDGREGTPGWSRDFKIAHDRIVVAQRALEIVRRRAKGEGLSL